MLYPNLKKAMGIEGITKTDISRVLHIHFNTVTDRLEGNTSSKKEDNYLSLIHISEPTRPY